MLFKRVALVCGCLAMVSMAFGQGVEVSSPRISIAYNSQLQRRIEWKGPNGGNIVAFDPSVQEGVVVSGLEVNTFRLDPGKTSLKRIVDWSAPSAFCCRTSTLTQPSFRTPTGTS
jgi:hypothetical protein